MDKDELLPCCGYHDTSAVKWNPGNKVVQCHNCGHVYTALTAQQPQQEAVAEILPLLASAWFYGGWKAETANERRMQEIMTKAGYWPIESEDHLLSLRAEAEKLPQSHVRVPVEPTEAMMIAASHVMRNPHWGDAKTIYQAMLRAAQEGKS